MMQKKPEDAKMQQEIGQVYMELQILDRQIKTLQAQAQSLEAQTMEVRKISESLDELGNSKIGSEILVPISAGIFAKAELKENQDLLVAVGGGTVVKKKIPEIKKMLESQIGEIKKVQQEFSKQLERLSIEAEKKGSAITSLLVKK